MSSGILLTIILVVSSLILVVMGGYQGRPQTMVGETPLAGIVRPVPIGGLSPIFHTQCCPCMSSVNQIYPRGYNVINGNLNSPPIINQALFHDHRMIMPSLHKPVHMPSEPEPTPETGGSNGGGDR